MDPLFTHSAQYFIATVLLIGAVSKYRDPRSLEAALAVIFPIAAPARKLLSFSVPSIELVVGISILLPVLRGFGTWAALGLIGLYTLALTGAFIRGERGFDCGCSFGKSGPAAHPSLLIRNAILLVAGLVAVMPSIDRPLLWFDGINLVFSTAALLTFYIALEALLALPVQPNWRQS